MFTLFRVLYIYKEKDEINVPLTLSVFRDNYIYIYVCPLVALLKATYAENSHIVLSSRY